VGLIEPDRLERRAFLRRCRRHIHVPANTKVCEQDGAVGRDEEITSFEIALCVSVSRIAFCLLRTEIPLCTFHAKRTERIS